jgi:hypothetical protein
MTTTCFYGPLSPSCSDLVVITISHIDTINTRSRGLSPYQPPIHVDSGFDDGMATKVSTTSHGDIV